MVYGSAHKRKKTKNYLSEWKIVNIHHSPNLSSTEPPTIKKKTNKKNPLPPPPPSPHSSQLNRRVRGVKWHNILANILQRASNSPCGIRFSCFAISIILCMYFLPVLHFVMLLRRTYIVYHREEELLYFNHPTNPIYFLWFVKFKVYFIWFGKSFGKFAKKINKPNSTLCESISMVIIWWEGKAEENRMGYIGVEKCGIGMISWEMYCIK